ncbi:predicted protein [Naegleria gruberi]|uniref:Geranylgeranyl transferase type-1 subunit beta n=1 Tax=Naegleria gruberi TaxID=5762 RepID=D2VCW8_NAEGR|nr:uncharacterized protein NAEGRDRAFT_32923 [Naegleria gruberi]EFC45377.1 predicted protein [Naegleria gruberi]|eukprot:XP_002678121.1 predicted protein [Naegleria gruberi strain NEG-M]
MSSSSASTNYPPLEVDKHVKYFMGHCSVLPHFYGSQDTNRMTILYFIISGLDVLGKVDLALNDERKKEIIEWVYSNQIGPDQNESNLEKCGFRGGNFIGLPIGCYECCHEHPLSENQIRYDVGHIAMTYTALAILRILGDDFSRVNKKSIIGALKYLQDKNGCFKATCFGSETDIRFTFCACAISAFLNDWSGVNKELAFEYIKSSRGYDYCFSHGPGLESHGGSTYCAIAALDLMGYLDKLDHQEEMKEWLLKRQLSGFQGRPQKDADTCYSFWVGGTLQTLDCLQYVDEVQTKLFTLSCQTEYGGISKVKDTYPDVLHTYMSLAGLSMLGFEGLNKVFPSLNITERAAKGLECFDSRQ